MNGNYQSRCRSMERIPGAASRAITRGRFGVNRFAWLALPVAITLGVLVSWPAESAVVATVRVGGLPSGLSVSFRGEFTRCDAGGPAQFISTGAVALTEQTLVSFERETVLGQPRIVRKERTHYVGETAFEPPADNGCSVVPDGTFRYFYGIGGETADGQPRIRSTAVIRSATLVDGRDVQFNDILKGETESITQNGAAPTTIPKGQFQDWSVTYLNSFGNRSTRQMSLEFFQTTDAVLPIAIGASRSVSRIKMTLTDDNQLCLRVDGTTRCRLRQQRGELTSGGVTVSVGGTTISLDGKRTHVNWRFRIDPAFQGGALTASASAEDRDPIAYLIDGEPQARDLLPWVPLRLPVTVTE